MTSAVPKPAIILLLNVIGHTGTNRLSGPGKGKREAKRGALEGVQPFYAESQSHELLNGECVLSNNRWRSIGNEPEMERPIRTGPLPRHHAPQTHFMDGVEYPLALQAP